MYHPTRLGPLTCALIVVCIQPVFGFGGTGRTCTEEASYTQCDVIKSLLTNSMAQNTQIQLRYETQNMYGCFVFVLQWLYILVSCFYLLQSAHSWDAIRYRLAFHLKCGICLALAVIAVLMHQHFNLPFLSNLQR